MIRFCPRCGAKLAEPAPTVCADCGYEVYQNARPCAGVVVLNPDREFLAIRRARDPAAGRWDVPGGFCEEREHPRDAAVRELHEETGLDLPVGPLLGLYLDDYEFFGDVVVTLKAYYLAEENGQVVTADPAEVSELDWFPLTAPPDLGFPHEYAVLADVRRLIGFS